MLRTATAFGSTEDAIPEFAKLPVRRVRETIIAAAHMWDDFLRIKSDDEPMMRLLLQDEAQTQVLSLDLVRVVQGGERNNVPVFVVRWVWSLASSMKDALAAIGTMERGTKMSEIKVEVDEIVSSLWLFSSRMENGWTSLLCERSKSSRIFFRSVS